VGLKRRCGGAAGPMNAGQHRSSAGIKDASKTRLECCTLRGAAAAATPTPARCARNENTPARSEGPRQPWMRMHLPYELPVWESEAEVKGAFSRSPRCGFPLLIGFLCPARVFIEYIRPGGYTYSSCGPPQSPANHAPPDSPSPAACRCAPLAGPLRRSSPPPCRSAIRGPSLCVLWC